MTKREYTICYWLINENKNNNYDIDLRLIYFHQNICDLRAILGNTLT